MELLVAKFLYVLSIVALSLVCSLLPLLLKKVNPRTQQRTLSLSNSFAGGVFLAGGFVHLLTEANEMVDDLGWSEYPVGGILSVVGFLTVFFIEQVVLAKLGHNHSHSTGPEESNHHTDTPLEASPVELEPFELEVLPNKESPNESSPRSQRQPKTDANTSEPTITPERRRYSFVSIALVVILSAHSFFTGATMGAQRDLTSTTEIFFTVITHKWIESFALGTNLVRNGESIASVLQLALVYSITLPAGVLCGAIVVVLLSEHFAEVATMLATGFGSGSFIYIAIVDILVLEFTPHADKMVKFAIVSAGFICVTAIFVAFDND